MIHDPLLPRFSAPVLVWVAISVLSRFSRLSLRGDLQIIVVMTIFYLQSKTAAQIKSSGTQVWFKREPLGVASLGKFLPKACQIAGIEARGNHGVRAMTVQRLRKACVPDDKIVHITGHKSTKTLSVYDADTLSNTEHESYQKILQGVPNADTSLANADKSVVPKSATYGAEVLSHQSHTVSNQSQANANSSMFSGAVLSNCVFNFHCAAPEKSVVEKQS